MNSLSIRGLRNNVRILLVNNNGGIEFKLHGENRKIQNRYIAAADYHGSAQGWAESCGFDYYSAENMTEFSEIVPKFVSKSKNSIILEVFVNDYDESDAYLKIVDENKKKIFRDTISAKKIVKDIIGEKTYNKLKHSIKG